MGVGLQLHRKRDSYIGIFCEFCEICQGSSFSVRLWVTTSENSSISSKKTSAGRTPAKLVFQKTEGFKERGH